MVSIAIWGAYADPYVMFPLVQIIWKVNNDDDEELAGVEVEESAWLFNGSMEDVVWDVELESDKDEEDDGAMGSVVGTAVTTLSIDGCSSGSLGVSSVVDSFFVPIDSVSIFPFVLLAVSFCLWFVSCMISSCMFSVVGRIEEERSTQSAGVVGGVDNSRSCWYWNIEPVFNSSNSTINPIDTNVVFRSMVGGDFILLVAVVGDEDVLDEKKEENRWCDDDDDGRFRWLCGVLLGGGYATVGNLRSFDDTFSFSLSRTVMIGFGMLGGEVGCGDWWQSVVDRGG